MAPAELTYNFLINPKSGKGSKHDTAKVIVDFFNQHRHTHQIFYTEYPGHARELANKLTAKNQVIVAVGGDGTIHEIADGLKGSQGCLGLLPAGSGNGLARHLGVSMDLKIALEQLISSRIVQMDLLTINGKLSINIGGIGFDGFIAKEFTNQTSRGLSGYVRLIVQNFFSYREFEYDLELDQQSISGKAFSIAFCNGSQYGNQARIASEASVTDGLMDIVVIRKPRLFQIPKLVFQVMRGKLNSGEFVQLYKGQDVNVRLKQSIDLQLDGEFAGTVEMFGVQVIPKALNILRP